MIRMNVVVEGELKRAFLTRAISASVQKQYRGDSRRVLLQRISGARRIAQLCTANVGYPPMNGAGQISLFWNSRSQWDHNVII